MVSHPHCFGSITTTLATLVTRSICKYSADFKVNLLQHAIGCHKRKDVTLLKELGLPYQTRSGRELEIVSLFSNTDADRIL